MKILKIEGNLIDILGDDARKNWEKECGLKFHNGHQNIKENIILLEVIDEEKASKYYNLDGIEIIDEFQANVVLAEKMDKTTYKKYDEALYGANIQKKITDESLNIDEMLPEWSEEEELKYLYNKGISGIKKEEIIIEKFNKIIK